MKKLQLFLLTLIVICAALLRFSLPAQGFFAFTYDQGRDLLAVKDIVENQNPTLIGPTTGLPGVFYGPWWYYFLAPIYLFTSGNPTAITLAFGLIGTISIIFLYLLVKNLTNNQLVALWAIAIAAMSQPFLGSSTQILSPSLVLPLMMLYVLTVSKIFLTKKPLWFLILGLSCALIADSGAAFGIMLIASSLITLIIFKREFSLRSYLYFSLGVLIMFLPRIVFDLRNDFLITKSAINWLNSPNIYQAKLTLLERFASRADSFYLSFAQTFAQSSKTKSAVSLIILTTLIFLGRKSSFSQKPTKFLLIVLLLIYLGFSLYPDAVWGYYLEGLPIIFLIIFSTVAAKTLAKKPLITGISLAIVFAINFHFKILSPFSITWEGDGAIYRNQSAVLESLAGELMGDYSLYVYTPARFDYPFDYLLGYYHRQGNIEPPKEDQKRFYLIIRDDETHSYLTSGWYGDKTQDNTKLLDRNTYQGNIIVEKHLRNE